MVGWGFREKEREVTVYDTDDVMSLTCYDVSASAPRLAPRLLPALSHIASRHVTCPHGGESAKRYSSALAGNVPSVSMPPGVKVVGQGQGGAGQGE